MSREKLRDQQHCLNVMMERYAADDPDATYVDVSSVLSDCQGKIIDALFMEDHLHLNPEGYSLWNDILRPLLIRQCEK